MKILLTGSHGLVGSAFFDSASAGHSITRVVRRDGSASRDEVPWNPARGFVDTAALEGFDTAVHLAGENIAEGRWTAAKKERIRQSRVEGTETLCKALASLKRPPRVIISASAIGYYGDRGETWLDEQSRPGSGFLPDVCRAWENATQSAAQAGIRVVNLRFGVILASGGGALAKMLTPFRLGMGGKIGSGRQYMSWITIDDAIAAIHHSIATEPLSGPVNAVSPHPVTNAEFTKSLGSVLGRPTIFPLPAAAARLIMGQMADELLLASTRVAPKRLAQSGYAFRHAEIEPALRHVLNRE